MRPWLVKSVCNGLHYSGIEALLSPWARGVGGILMLHSVGPAKQADFTPNDYLSISPEFLDELLGWLASSGFDVVAMDEAAKRTARGHLLAGENPFIALTFDDGYADNAMLAAPILRRHGVPYTIYVATGLLQGTADLWWEALEWVIEAHDTVRADLGDGETGFDTSTPYSKCVVYEKFFHHCEQVLGEDTQRAFISDLCAAHGVDARARSVSRMMTAEQLVEIANDPLCTIGAHTADHHALAKLPEEAARADIAKGLEDLTDLTGRRPRHFAYPYGSRRAAGQREYALAAEFGFTTAVTTARGKIYAHHHDRLMALPRLSINGNFQSLAFTRQWVNGVPSWLYNKLATRVRTH